MKVLILGSGVVGVTTAYVLATRGYEVEVIDRGEVSATETSYSNGGQLSYSHAEPWANPGVFPKVFKWMFQDDAPLVLRPRADWRMMKWGLQFLGNCTLNKANASTVTMLRIGLYSKKKMDQLLAITGIKCDHSREGILHVFTDPATFEQGKKQAHFQESLGCKEKILTPQQCLDLEPALEHSPAQLVGGIHAHLDESGDAKVFTQELARICQQEFGVKFHYGVSVQQLVKSNGQIAAVKTDKGDFTADRYVMSLGSYSSYHLSKIGLNVPIYPMKGYSVTLPVNHYSPRISITDPQAKIVYSRLGNNLRVAGTAEFAGYNAEVKEKRIVPILNAIRTIFPQAVPEDDNSISRWACLRPSTPDGPPIIGFTPVPNLWMNTGHGTLGWTQAAGSAFLFADVFEGKKPEVSLDGMTLERYL